MSEMKYQNIIVSIADMATGKGDDEWSTSGLSEKSRESLLAWGSSVVSDPRTTHTGEGDIEVGSSWQERGAAVERWLSKLNKETTTSEEMARICLGKMFENALTFAGNGSAMDILATLLASSWATQNVSSRYLRETAWILGKEGDLDSLLGVCDLLKSREQALDAEEAIQMGFIGACAGGRKACAEKLIEEGALVNGHCPPKAKAEKGGGDALVQALANRRWEVADWLIENGAEAGPAHAVADWLWHANGNDCQEGVKRLTKTTWVRSDIELKTIMDKIADDRDVQKMIALDTLGAPHLNPAETKGFWICAASKTNKEEILSGRWGQFVEAAMKAGVQPPTKDDVERLDEALSNIGKDGVFYMARKRALEDIEAIRAKIRPETTSLELKSTKQMDSKPTKWKSFK